MKVVEIFNSIEGEGKRIGLPCTFIRLCGCNLNCSYCDSQYACHNSEYTEMSILDILKVVDNYGCPNVTVTGGEPLIHKDIDKLLLTLTQNSFKVNVETNGTVEPPVKNNNIFYTVDYKTDCSGMSLKMNKGVFKKLTNTDVIKFVVGSEDDLDQAVEFYKTLDTEAEVFISPVWGLIELKQLVDFVKLYRLWNWRVQVQLHKIIWNPDKRGV